MSPPDAFERFARTCARVFEARGKLEKTRIVATYLRQVPARDLPDAAVFLTGEPYARVDARTLQVGGSTLRAAALDLLPWDEEVYNACHRAVGDTGETLGKLFTLTPPPREAPQRTLHAFADAPAPDDAGAFTLADARRLFDDLANARRNEMKTERLRQAWRRLGPLEVQYLTKIVTGGMRIGLQESLVEEALAKAFDRPLSAVREANMLMGDIGRTAHLARLDRLHEAEFRLFHPLHFMLAAPLDEAEDFAPLADAGAWVVEDKYDGVRAQLHAADGRVALYTRTLGEATGEFPEIVDAARRLLDRVVLDGELVAWKNDRALPFGALQRRLGRKTVPAELQREVPVRFIAYDALYVDGEPLHRLPLTDRRRRLATLPLEEPLAVSDAVPACTVDAVRAAFTAALDRGNEGVMLKRVDSGYEFGKRGRHWLKLKQPFATLDVVVTAAEEGHGKRAGLLSDYTFAVRDEATGDLANVGKAFSGVTDEEIRQLTRRFQRITLERYGRVRLVRPEVVLEVAFDGVQASARHKSGYALRFPRIVRLRPDKRPEDVDTLQRVRDLHARSLGK